MHKRFEEKLRVSYAVDPALERCLVPQLILQPLVENSLRHAWRPDRSALSVCVAAHRDDGRLVLQVSDTGVGLGSDAAACLTRDVGLSNISQRLARLYGEEQRLAIANRDGGGAEVTLSLPYRSDP